MKRILPLLVILPFVLAGCVREPYADFYSSASVVETFEIIQFHNISDNFKYLEWDFGDGTYSTNSNPSHHYAYADIYTVTLTVYGYHGGVDRAFQDIEVLSPATLEITVLEYWNEYPVANASVILYPSHYDWINETNAITDGYGNVLEGFTDSYGVVTFTGLDPVSYWIDVWHLNYNNYLLADEDEDFIRTLPLERGMINSFVAYVDYVASSSKKAGREISKSRVVMLKRTYKDTQQSKQQLLK